ncbi:MAG: hypothetical protein E7079_05945 [Bacteroidales bacterium]|nr:hypothetical protein [Bacteroidales bacterium]
MRQIFSFLMVVVLCVCSACADDFTTTDVSSLPAKAQQCLKYFDSPVAYIEVDNDGVFGKTYDVKLKDGSEIDFDKKGEWKSIDTNHKPVPAAFVHKSIGDYVKKNYPDTFISKIERDSIGYDVELSNHMDLKFDTNGNFVRFDD